MKIYTRGGDAGQTRIYADKPIRVGKDDLILASYGDIDELNSQIGLLVAQTEQEKVTLQTVQYNLFQLGYLISATSSLGEKQVTQLENDIDRLSALLPAQRQFILPGGCVAAAQAHVCRTVCRRAERTLVALSHQHDVPATALAYINRLSDYLFVLARYCNHQAGVADVEVPAQ